MNANLTWVFTLTSEPNAAKYEERGKTFEEATKNWTQVGTPILVRREWEKYAWPGGYPLYYVTQDGGCLCTDCANENLDRTIEEDGDKSWLIAGCDINYEDTGLYCDNCNKFVECAYGDNIEGDLND